MHVPSVVVREKGADNMMGGCAAALLFLVPCSIWDIKTREIPTLWIIAGGTAAVSIGAWYVVSGEMGVMSLLFAMSPGIFLLALSVVTEQQIGAGDGISAAILGLLIGAPMIYMVLMGALILSSIYAAGLLVLRKGSRHSRMPWIPFMAAGLLIFMLLEIVTN